MRRMKWTIAVAVLMILIACTSRGTTQPPFQQDLGDVAIVVLDDFRDADKPKASTGVENCIYTGLRAGEVGDSGGGDGLPDGVSHGAAVSEVLRGALNAPRHRLRHTGDLNTAVPGGAVVTDTWRFGDHKIYLVEVDTAGQYTQQVAARLPQVLDGLKVTRFVLNMSFIIYPCDVRSWFSLNEEPLTTERMVSAYRDAIDQSSEVDTLHGILNGLVEEGTTVDELLGNSRLSRVTPAVHMNLFYGTFAALSH